MRRKAFTLIELLTVVAITGVLLTLIIVPLFQGFNFTRQAQAYAEAQERARQLSARLVREVGNAVAVRDNSGYKGAITVVVPNAAGEFVPVTLRYTKLDLVQPSEGDPGRGPSGAYINPYTGKEDPTLDAPIGDVNLPLTQGLTFERYFIALSRPVNADGTPGKYTNPHDGLLMQRNAVRDNLFVLYRATVQPYVYVNGQPVVNLALFTDNDGDNVPDDIDDPAFMTLLPNIDYNPTNNVYTAAGLLKADRIRRWLAQGRSTIDVGGTPVQFPNGRATILGEVSRFDAVQPVFDKRTRVVVQDNVTDFIEPGVTRERPRLIPLIQFKPTRVASDPAEGQLAARLGEETENSGEIAPDVFTTKLGGWTNALVKVLPVGFDRSDEALDTYIVGRTDPSNGLAGEPPGFSLYFFDPDGTNEETLDGIEFFDVAAYESTVASAGAVLYPFSQAVAAADARSAWLSDPTLLDEFIAFFPDSQTGKLVASFNISEIGDGGISPPMTNPNNLPASLTGFALSPQQDTGAGQPYSPKAGVYQINGAFNRVWNENPGLRPAIHRFIDLRVTPQADGTLSPLDPIDGFFRARIVPGSEEVFGPDQNPGPNYGQPIRYTRVTRSPGPNQYRINYVDLPEPDYLLAGFASTPPAAYDPNDFMSAVIQPRYRAGYIELNSDPNVPLPEGEFQVFYRFQFTRPNDTFMVTYDTRQVIGINLTILTYPQTPNVSSQTVSLQTSATARNFIR